MILIDIIKIMSIKCQICQKEFESMIHHTHLTLHSISSVEYKRLYGENSMATDEYRINRARKISENRKGKYPAHNKGQKITDPEQLKKIREAIKKRDQKYNEQGYHPLNGHVVTDETKRKISESVIRYASNNQDKLIDRARKIIKTKQDRNYDFGSSTRGKKLSPLAKQKCIDAIKLSIKIKKENATKRYIEFAKSINLSVLGQNENFITFKCNNCNNITEITKQYLTKSKLRPDLCPYCREPKTKSNDEIKIFDYIKTLTNDTVLSGNRNTIFPLELDIFLPNKNIAIEYCGLYWHSDLKGKDKTYHMNKQKLCEQKGIRLITIFEDEWKNKENIVKSRLGSIFQKNKTIYARKCKIIQIDNGVARSFCDDNHLQGQGQSNISYGLYYNDGCDDDTLISVMTFSKPNISKGGKSLDNIWELNRFCNKLDINVIGAASKLLSKFIKNHDPLQIISYSDKRWNTGNVYKKIGFDYISSTPPNYWYIDFPNLRRLHRFSLRKNKQDNELLTEWENRKLQGWNRIWDCGNDKYVWNKKGGK